MAWRKVEDPAADVSGSNTGESTSIRVGVVGVGAGGEFDAFVNHPESGMFLLVAIELPLDAVENHTDSGLLLLDGEQAILKAMLANEQAILQAVLARKQEAGKGDAGGDNRDEFGGHGLHERIVPEAFATQTRIPGR